MSGYTTADFANARFAEHADGDFAARLWPDGPADPRVWESRRNWFADEEMARGGWVPVPTKPTITRPELLHAVNEIQESQYATTEARFAEGLLALGFSVDLEPTNVEKLARKVMKIRDDHGRTVTIANQPDAIAIAEYLDANGVKAGN